MKVVGTAGHIDHGKSTLVHRLTGMNPDRLLEEKRRGMTIDLGFAWLILPSGQQISIVDVPGHERFIKNMLAGAAGVDVALLVIAADEGIMPQTREHLDILDLLGVHHGVVALTKTDLVDDEWLLLVEEEVREALSDSSLQTSSIVAVSSLTGHGLDALLLALDAAVSASQAARDDGVPFLPADRVFTVRGFGTVVTGTLHGGTFHLGEDVEVIPTRRRARIRGLQTHGKNTEEAAPGSRVAVNLSGAAVTDIARGGVLAKPGTVRSASRVDGRVRVLKDAPVPLAHASNVTAHLGSAERSARVSLLSGSALEPGQSGWIQLRFEEPVAVVRGQHFVLRMPAPMRTIAGGVVVDVAPRHRRSDATLRRRLEGMLSGDLGIAVSASLTGKKPMKVRDVSLLLGVDSAHVEAALDAMEEDETVIRLGDWYLTVGDWSNVRERVRSVLSSFHEKEPMRRGMPKQELARKVGWSGAAWVAAIEAMARSGVVRQHDVSISLPTHSGGTASRRDEANRVVEELRAHGFSPPTGAELRAAVRTDDALLGALVDEGDIVRVDDDLYFARDTYAEARARVLEILGQTGHVTVAAVRDDLGTSRKFALALLEHLDSERTTKRIGDVRVLGANAPSCT